MSKRGSDAGGHSKLLQEIRTEKLNSSICKRFQDEFFAIDILKTLYDDDVEAEIKIELLIVLEEYGHLGIDHESVDQVVTSLLDIHHQRGDQEESWAVSCQILITASSLIIQLDQGESDVCQALVKELVAIVTSKVNQPDSRRIRSCACQCLIHLETFHRGLLFHLHNDFARLARQERTDVYTDYALLAAQVMFIEETPDSSPPSSQDAYRKQVSIEVQDFRQMAAYVVESAPLFTPCGTWRATQSLVTLVQTLPEVSPMIFKPLMLHGMSTMSSVLFHTILYLQREFEGEILTGQEEAELLDRLATLVDHPSLTIHHKLLALQWTQGYTQNEAGQPVIHDHIIDRHRLKFYPTVFDPVDIQLSKLYMTALCGDTRHDNEGIETSILLGSVGCLHKLVWHTGSNRAAIALFRALYFFFHNHNNQSFAQDIQRFVRGLVSEFPYFIPHSIDFIESIRNHLHDSRMYQETLILLHKQVSMATEDQIASSYQFYLQIMKTAALEKDIPQSATLKFLQYLSDNAPYIDDSSWRLGHGLLAVCRNLLICHGTDRYYTELGDLLYELMTRYNDIDVQDKANFYYALITGASDKKVQSVLQDTIYGAETMTQAISTLLPSNIKQSSLAQITNLDIPVFTWQRLSVAPSIHGISTDMTNPEPSTYRSTSDMTRMVKQYYEHLWSQEMSVDFTYRLALEEDGEYEKAHAVSIHVDVTHDYTAVQDTHVPCILRGGHRDIVLNLKPKLPFPETFNASVTFGNDQKQTFCCKLPPVDVSFSQLLLPLPWKPATGSDIIQLFEELWEWILKPKEDKSRGVQSVKTVDVTFTQFQSLCRHQLSPFLVSGTDTVCLLAICLPPQYHLLLKCQGHQQSLVVSIVTDLLTILPHIERFLEDLER